MTQSIIDDIDTSISGRAKIKVIGVGGAGGNAVQEMINAQLVGVEFICANTDMQALCKNSAPRKVQLGEKLTRGLGAGAKPEVGREAANESLNAIRDAISDADMVFITAGLGGGTGTGAAPVVAQAARDLSILTVGVVTKPFTFEGPKRMKSAEAGLEELRKYVDCLIVIPNDRLVNLANKKVPLSAMFQKANEVLLNGVRGISDVINRDGFINVDFADVRTTMGESGIALMGTGRASGENRAREATQQAIMSPLLEDVSLESAKAILYNITASESISMAEMNEIGQMINDAVVSDNINIIFGVVYDESMGEDLQVTVIATGIEPVLEEDLTQNSGAIVTKFTDPVVAPAPKKVFPRRMPAVNDDFDGNEEKEVAAERPIRRPMPDYRYNEPPVAQPYARRSAAAARMTRHAPGQDGYSFDADDYEIPTFLRRQAD